MSRRIRRTNAPQAPGPGPDTSSRDRWRGLRLALIFIAAVWAVDLLAHTRAVLIAFLALAPLLAAAVETARRTAAVAAVATAVAVAAGAVNDIFGSLDHLLRVAVVAAVGVVAVYVARARGVRERRLRQVTEIAQAAQRAVLRAVPEQVGEVAFAARYLSAYETAEIGGDLYEVVATPFGVRAVVGDVCGKGLDGVRLAATVTSAFRQAAFVHADLADVVHDLDTAVIRDSTIDGGDPMRFVTAVLVEFAPRELRVVNCAHPPPVLRRAGGHIELLAPAVAHPPFGMGLPMAPVRHSYPWCADDRVLLYTDGLIEARNSDQHFLPIAAVYPSLAADSRESCLDAVIDLLRRHTGGRPGDDSALLLAEHRPHARLPAVDEPQAEQAPAAG